MAAARGAIDALKADPPSVAACNNFPHAAL